MGPPRLAGGTALSTPPDRKDAGAEQGAGWWGRRPMIFVIVKRTKSGKKKKEEKEASTKGRKGKKMEIAIWQNVAKTKHCRGNYQLANPLQSSPSSIWRSYTLPCLLVWQSWRKSSTKKNNWSCFNCHHPLIVVYNCA